MKEIKQAVNSLSKEDQVILASLMLTVVNYTKQFACSLRDDGVKFDKVKGFMEDTCHMWSGLFEMFGIPIPVLDHAQQMLEEMNEEMGNTEDKGGKAEDADMSSIIARHMLDTAITKNNLN